MSAPLFTKTKQFNIEIIQSKIQKLTFWTDEESASFEIHLAFDAGIETTIESTEMINSLSKRLTCVFTYLIMHLIMVQKTQIAMAMKKMANATKMTQNQTLGLHFPSIFTPTLANNPWLLSQ